VSEINPLRLGKRPTAIGRRSSGELGFVQIPVSVGICPLVRPSVKYYRVFLDDKFTKKSNTFADNVRRTGSVDFGLLWHAEGERVFPLPVGYPTKFPRRSNHAITPRLAAHFVNDETGCRVSSREFITAIRVQTPPLTLLSRSSRVRKYLYGGPGDFHSRRGRVVKNGRAGFVGAPRPVHVA